MLPQRKDGLIPNIPQPLVQKRLEQGYENSFVLKYLQGHQIYRMFLVFVRQILPKHIFLHNIFWLYADATHLNTHGSYV